VELGRDPHGFLGRRALPLLLVVPREQLEASGVGRLGCSSGHYRALQEEVAVDDREGLPDVPDPGVAQAGVAIAEVGGERSEPGEGLPRGRREVLVGAVGIGEEVQHPVAAVHSRPVGFLHRRRPTSCSSLQPTVTTKINQSPLERSVP
jgi:hypothetical protein